MTQPDRHLLVVDDDDRIRDLLREFLARAGFRVTGAADATAAWRLIETLDFDLMVLDVMMPGEDGLSLARRLRARTDQPGRTPVLMLTARGEAIDRIEGLTAGVDDYLAKPFEPRELVARIQNILKRSGRAVTNGAVLDYGALVVDTQLRNVLLHGTLLGLSSMEYQLLEMLARQPGKTFSRDEILNTLKGVDADDLFTRSVDILISRLRTKLKPLDCIKTQRGSGYCFVGKVTS